MDKMNNCPGVMVETSTYPQRSPGSSDSEHFSTSAYISLFKGVKKIPESDLLVIRPPPSYKECDW